VFERFVMLRIRSQGDDVYLLSDRDDRPVGWVRDRTIHFAGFESYADAVAAAIHGGNALEAYLGGTSVLGRASHASPPDGSSRSRAAPGLVLRDVRLTHDGAHEWVIVSEQRVARIVPSVALSPGYDRLPHPSGGPPAPSVNMLDAGKHAVEFMMPHGMAASACLTVAQVLGGAVAHHRPTRRPAVPWRGANPVSVRPRSIP
jgi:hypothetical protein